MEKIMVNVAGVEREATEQEAAQLLKDWENAAKLKQEENNKKIMRESALAKLAALGLTEDEIAAL